MNSDVMVGDHPIVLQYARSIFGHLVVLDIQHATLPGSQWLGETLYKFGCERAKKLKGGQIEQWTGTLRRFKNGSCRFIHGTTDRVR